MLQKPLENFIITFCDVLIKVVLFLLYFWACLLGVGCVGAEDPLDQF